MHLTHNELAVLAGVGPLVGVAIGAFWNSKTQKTVSKATAENQAAAAKAAIESQQSIAERGWQAQQRQAADHRVWTERKSVYVKALEHIARGALFRDTVTAGGQDPDANYDPTTDEWVLRQVELDAWASQEVFVLADASNRAHFAWAGEFLNWKTWRAERAAESRGEVPPSGEDFGTVNRELADRVEKAKEAADLFDQRLREAIRAELQGGSAQQ
ncbi:hypothetical protein [Catenulispora sp. EB89]|uniref:hypothetical protein n=1 Tax=Catenulispora sp. EB89 TaxID=3156257 RepID=UPI003513FE24